MKKTHSILIIDDDHFILKLCKDILELEGYKVLLASDGVYGTQIVSEGKVDLVLLDITMPGPSGYQVIKAIREFSNIPIIMVTGTTDKDAIKKCLDQGADDYVTKPFSPLELTARIRTKMKRHSQQMLNAMNKKHS